MNEVFKKEWELYTAAGSRPQFRGLEKRVWSKGFDGPVKVGEIRVFADMNRPFVALVVEDRGKVGYRIVPVSPFTVPASAREVLIGERVFQLWNAVTAAKSFVERSWVVETLAAEDVAEIAASVASVSSGARSEDATAREYERAFAVSGGNFRGLLADGTAKVGTSTWRRRAGWSIAAMLFICCGIGGLWYEEVLCDRRVAAVKADAARMEAYRAKLAANFENDLECEIDCLEVDDEADQEPEVEIAVEIPPIMPQVLGNAVPNSETVLVKPAEQASVALIRSPVRMRSMCGSRTPATVYGDPAVVRSPQPTTERYAEFAENEFVSPKSEPLSTFGLDVDTSSYALMRSSINDQKRLPPKDSVRLEEFVNYFKYDYPQPKGDEPVAVDCELATCPWNAKHRLLRLGVQAKTVEEKNLPPCNLTFLIDVSGSMEWNNGLEMAKQGLKMLVEKLRDEDHVAIVTYANGTAVRLPSVSGREKKAIGSVIDELYASGGTTGGDGIQRAYAEAQKNFDKQANNRVILVTDGDFNIGISSPKELEDFIAAKRESGVFLTVLGVGRGNYQDANMKKLANAGNGNYAFLDSVLEAKKVMMNEFGGTLMTVAKDVKVQIEFNPSEVEGYRLLGYENRRLAAKDFNDDKKDAGEIGSGHTMTAFYEIIPAGTGEMGAGTDPLKYQKSETAKSGELMTVKMRYKKPDGDRSILIEKAHTAAEMTRKEPSVDFRFASAVAEFALLLKDSKFKGAASYPKLIERARSAKGADREGYRAEFIRLAETAELMAEKASKITQNGYRHIDGCYGDAQRESVVMKALRELKQAQAADGSWGTNKVADTAWTMLAFLSHGEVPVSSASKEFGETVRKGGEYLIGAADEVSEPDLALTAYALVSIYDMTRYPGASGAAVKLFGKMQQQKDDDPSSQLLRVEACWLAQATARHDLVAMANEMMPKLMAWWRAFDAKGEDIAYKCRALMLGNGSPQGEALPLLDQMRNWKPGEERSLTASFCVALCKHSAGMCANARPGDINAWREWNLAMKAYLPSQLTAAGDVSTKALRILQETVTYRYRRSLPRPTQTPSKPPRPPEVQVEVDI